jgi:hypothetical protein
VRGLTASSKPSLILPKDIRNPFARNQLISGDILTKNGLFGMINSGHISRFADIKGTFNEIRRIQTAETSAVQSPTRTPTVHHDILVA